MKAYYINLDRSKKRNCQFIQQNKTIFDKLNIEMHRVVAYDGKKLESYPELVMLKKSNSVKLSHASMPVLSVI